MGVCAVCVDVAISGTVRGNPRHNHILQPVQKLMDWARRHKTTNIATDELFGIIHDDVLPETDNDFPCNKGQADTMFKNFRLGEHKRVHFCPAGCMRLPVVYSPKEALRVASTNGGPVSCDLCASACYNPITGEPLAELTYVPLKHIVQRLLARPEVVRLFQERRRHEPPEDGSMGCMWGKSPTFVTIHVWYAVMNLHDGLICK
jgi:hypothetical protein